MEKIHENVHVFVFSHLKCICKHKNMHVFLYFFPFTCTCSASFYPPLHHMGEGQQASSFSSLQYLALQSGKERPGDKAN